MRISNLVVGAWVGGDDRSIHFRSTDLGEGAKTAMPLVGTFLEKVYADPKFKSLQGPFPKPVGVMKEYENCGYSGYGEESSEPIRPKQRAHQAIQPLCQPLLNPNQSYHLTQPLAKKIENETFSFIFSQYIGRIGSAQHFMKRFLRVMRWALLTVLILAISLLAVAWFVDSRQTDQELAEEFKGQSIRPAVHYYRVDEPGKTPRTIGSWKPPLAPAILLCRSFYSYMVHPVPCRSSMNFLKIRPF